MKEATILRISLVTAALAIAAYSQAQVGLILVSHGDGALTGPTTVTFLESVDAQAGGLGELDDLTYTVDTGTLTGTGEYSGLGGTLDFSLAYDPASLKLDSIAGSIDGVWTYTGGTGGYAGLAGSGTLALTFLEDGPTSALTGTTFAGVLTPEPAPFVAMGLGVAGLLIRRRRKA